MNIEQMSDEDTAKQEFAQKYAPDLSNIDLDLSGTETAQIDVTHEDIEASNKAEEQAKQELVEEQSPNLELLNLDFLRPEQTEEERLFRVQFRQMVLANHAQGKTIEDVYANITELKRSDEKMAQSLPLQDIAKRLWRSAEQRGSADELCTICGKVNPSFEANCPSFCPYAKDTV
jgi:membrane-bound lytic murein transglycosylase